ncbi:MAG: hypothetical protein ABI333_10550 [bacterium]
MAPIGYHIRIHLKDNRVILQSPIQQRLLSRVVLQQGRKDNLLAFSLPDSHLHMEALCSEHAASRLCQRVGTSLKQRLNLPVSFTSYDHEPIRDQRHLGNSFRYVSTQHEQHKLDWRTFFEATNLPDLLGMRLIGGYTRENVQRCLPRVRRATILGWLELTGLQPADGPLHELCEATLSAAALSSLAGRSGPVVEARCAMIKVVNNRLSNVDAARLVGVTDRTVRSLKQRDANPELVCAIRYQLGLRQLVQRLRTTDSELLVAG